MGAIRLVRKSSETIKDYGFKVFLLKCKNYLSAHKAQRKMRKTPEKPMREVIFGDVLFINGCYLPHPSRYRVSHQREQMLANGMTSEEVFYTDLKLDFIKRYRGFIFYRCPYTETVGKFISAAKSFNKPVIFDIDDLVIDRKYTDNIPYLNTLNPDERKSYNNGVQLMQKTLRLCDAAITTTEVLARELKNYVPEVYINRNVASDAMVQRSEWAVYDRDVLPNIPDKQLESKAQKDMKKTIIKRRQTVKGQIKIGYFSGSITHNDDIELILPAITDIMKNHNNVHLYFVGELDVPEELKPFKERIHAMKFVDWQELPRLIADVDINIVPLADTIFNAAKSENKWTEAALVKVPTVASKVGAFEKMVTDGETGLLCSGTDEWVEAIEKLIDSEELRKKLAARAYDYVIANCITLRTGIPLCEYMKSKFKPNIAFVLPSLQISGGVLVALKHCNMLKKAGYDVFIVNDNFGNKNVVKDGEEIGVLSTKTDLFFGSIDVAVGTLWTTMDWVCSYRNIIQKAYIVQNLETRFYNSGQFLQFQANQTYSLKNVKYITISKWCERWLIEDYHQDPAFIPNGLDCKMFTHTKRAFNRRKTRILVEGNSDDYYKNVDESFKIVNMLDQDRFEVWFVSYQGEPKKWYRVDRFFHRVPYEKMCEIYRQCDILLKTSILESFSYPPLEMMATGGYVVVRPNEGNIEYLRDHENCLMYDGDNLQTAVDAIEKIVKDSNLRQKLFEGGLKTADERSWENCKESIISCYNTLKESYDGKSKS